VSVGHLDRLAASTRPGYGAGDRTTPSADTPDEPALDGGVIPRCYGGVTSNGDVEAGRDSKAMTLRLPSDLHERLAAVAEVEGDPIAEVVRRAVADHVEQRRREPEFRAKLEATLRRQQRLLDLLGED
jgi:predicted transcriptional regulator